MSQGHAIWIVGVAAAAAMAMGAAACTIGSDTYISSQEAASTADGGSSSSSSSSGGTPSGGGGAATCSTTDFIKPDLGTLTACGDGKGHCFAKDKVALAGQLTACADASQVCVPDEILEANGGKLKSCTSIIGPGGCVTATLIPEIIKQGGSALKPDVCSATQLCVPCVDPTHGGAPSGMCEPIGVHKNACSSGPAGGSADGGAAAKAPPCCTTNGKSNGVCLVETVVPEAQRSQAPQDTCATGNKCVPAAFVAGAQVTCAAGILGAGVCMDKCFNSMMSIAGGIGILSSKGCGTTELCIPCGLVSGQGVPGCPK
jgi:hypothetical protein